MDPSIDSLMEQFSRHPDGGCYEEELLQRAFTGPLIPGEQIYEPITSLDDIYETNRSMLLPVEHFYDAFDRLEIVEAEPFTLNAGATQLLRLTYRLAEREYRAYAYVKAGPQPAERAALIVPGSRPNLATGIYHEDPENNHTGIMEALDAGWDRYIFIKPNNDCLAFHNGRNRLDLNCYVNWLLEAGASYSAHYIASSLAFSRYLREKYGRCIVTGLSQGGAAALLNALQSHPDAAVIASGFSIITHRLQRASHNQIIIPGLRRRLSHRDIRAKIRTMPTRFFFTYGKEESGTYKIEATEGLSCRFLSPCENVTCKPHDGGHIYPAEMVRNFLNQAVPSDTHRG